MIVLASACQMFSALTVGFSEHAAKQHFRRPLVQAAPFSPFSLAWSHFLSCTSSVYVCVCVKVYQLGIMWHKGERREMFSSNSSGVRCGDFGDFYLGKALHQGCNGQELNTHLQLKEIRSGAHMYICTVKQVLVSMCCFSPCWVWRSPHAIWRRTKLLQSSFCAKA